MITPTFKVDQDENSVIIVIDTPYVRAQDVDLYVEGTEFRFYLRPYFLRLHFPAPIVEDDDSKATYDPSAGQFTIRVSKETKGQHFEDLDLLTKLLARTGESTSTEEKKKKKPLIEVIGEASQEELQDAVDFNWELPQALPTEELTLTAHYGFNNQYNGYFRHVHETMNEINELSEPERLSAEERREARVAAENERFNEDHYCMDCLNDEIQQLIKYKTIYAKELKRIQKQKTTEQKPLIQEVSDAVDPQQTSLLAFTSKEEAMMRDLPRKEYLLSFEKVTYLGLVDLLFAYSYNLRTTEGDNNVESVWCIGKISPTLSSLEQFTVLRDVVISCYRRALTYPLYRNFALCQKVLQDVYILFKLGKRAILKALLEMKDLFDHHDVYYVYSKIYLDDYSVWIQHASEHVLKTLAHELHHFVLSKNELGWDLEELEEIAEGIKRMEGRGEGMTEEWEKEDEERWEKPMVLGD